MKIALMHSLDFSQEALDIKKRLEAKGHEVSRCYSVSRVEAGDLSVEEIKNMKLAGNFFDYTVSKDLIRWNWERLKKDEAILVLNFSKNNITNYIGGNTFLEMGFAHVLNKPIFLWHDIPQMSYTDEIKAMQPIIINGNINIINNRAPGKNLII